MNSECKIPVPFETDDGDKSQFVFSQQISLDSLWEQMQFYFPGASSIYLPSKSKLPVLNVLFSWGSLRM